MPLVNALTVWEHCQSNTLYIPKALYGMRDVSVLVDINGSSVFYKNLEQSLLNIQFYTHQPCLVYIKSGTEKIVENDNTAHHIKQADALFLPQGHYLHSDYRKTHPLENLQAYLVFFSPQLITHFLANTTVKSLNKTNHGIHKINAQSTIEHFFQSLETHYRQRSYAKHLLNNKLLELLYLIDIEDKNKQLRTSLLATPAQQAKRNIKRLMQQYIASDLDIKDFASLSGRSLSSFNREFKKLYETSPKQWLIQQRLNHAYHLLTKEQLSVSRTASEIGYKNTSHFISAFKKQFGKTPKQIKTIDLT